MISVLRKFYRANFCSLGQRLILETFEQYPSAISVILLQKIEHLGKTKLTYKWCKSIDNSWSAKSIVDINTRCESIPETRNRLVTEFDDLLDLLGGMDQPPFENQLGTIKDGATHVVVWGNRKKFRSVVIRTPIKKSRYSELIKVVQKNIWL